MLIAHDLGTTGDKASLHSDDGRTVASVTVDYPTRFARGGVAEQDVSSWWGAVGTATRQLLDQTSTAAGAVSGIGLSGQMMGAVFLDDAFEAVRPAMIWADHRSYAQAARLSEQVGDDDAYAQLGHRIHPTYTLPKVMWLQEHEPASWRRTRWVCTAKDVVAARLTGRLVTDGSDASGTNAYDQARGTWSQTLLDAAGVEASVLPPVVASTTVVGGLLPDAATHLGLHTGTPVVLGGGDGPMAAVGAGVVSPEDPAYVCLGSSSWVSASAGRPMHDPGRRSMTFDHVVPGQYVPTATMQAGGASLSWVMELFGGDPATYARLLGEAAEVRAAEEDLFFLPHLLGERSPYWDATASGVFVGLRRHHGPAHLVRAVLEGVGLNLRTCIDAFTENGVSIDRLDVIGGGAQSDVWLQVLADVWQVPVRRRNVVADANSLGAAVTAAVGLGLVDGFGVARSLSRLTAQFDPAPGGAATAAEHHARFLAAYRAVEPWSHDRQG